MKNVQFTEEDMAWVNRVVEKFLKECNDDKVSPIAIHAALTILLKSCNDELRKDGIVIESYYQDEIPCDQTIN